MKQGSNDKVLPRTFTERNFHISKAIFLKSFCTATPTLWVAMAWPR